MVASQAQVNPFPFIKLEMKNLLKNNTITTQIEG